MLEDRIRYFEGRPQVYGTQFDWDEQGEMSPWPIEDPEGIKARREAVGLPPLAEKIQEVREGMARAGAAAPSDLAERRREQEAWARSVGWRDGDPSTHEAGPSS